MEHDALYLDDAPCFYFSCAEDGTLLTVNKTLCSKLGFNKQELVGKKADIIFTVATRIFQQTHFFPLLQMQHYAEEIFVTLQTRNKEQVPVLINAEQKTVDGKTVIVYAGIVVNNRKKFEDELIASKKAAEKALNENIALAQAKQHLQESMEQLDHQMHVVHKQNEELRQFNKAVTHDLQEPLRKLSVFSDMLEKTEEKQDQKKITNRLIHVLNHMHSIMSGLQEYVWLTGNVNKTESVNLNGILCAAEQQLKKEFKDVILIIEKEEIPVICADAKQMQVLFYQILANAIRFRKQGSEVNIKITANKLLLNKFKNIKEKYKYSHFLKIEITDAGIGFDAEYKEQAFELFKKLHSESGHGIGLALCKKIIENHQGNITIDSKPGEGTTVTVFLPC